MSDVVIRAEGLGKKYLIGHQSNERYTALRDVLMRTAKDFARSARDMMRGRPLVEGDEIEEFWALKDVDFEIKRSDVVGVIGRNGAGKSTLLKILSRITEPSAGRVEIKGRVASLLEVGTGFHPELTGRENIFLNGAILGMTRTEIRRKFDEIVAFAEVEQFLDTPVKRYSSGMYVRLAFAVAAHLEPEILVVDEVLAVGDAEFQKKCLGKMGEVAGQGRTVMFVSHNMNAVRSLCGEGVLLQRGELKIFGAINDVVAAYASDAKVAADFVREKAPASPIYLESAAIFYNGASGGAGAKACLDLSIRANNSAKAAIEVRIKDAFGGALAFSTIGGFNPHETIRFDSGSNNVRMEIDAEPLAKGAYWVSVDITDPNIHYFDRVEDCLFLTVEPILHDGSTRCLDQQYGFGSVCLAAKLASA